MSHPLSRTAPDRDTTRHPATWAGAALVGGLTLVVFLPALRNGFVNFDDAENFLKNPYYRGLGWDNLRWMFMSAHTGHYIPIAWLTLGLDYVLWDMKPQGYHLTSIVLHAVNAVLFYFIALRLSQVALAQQSRPLLENGEAVPLGACAAALLFSLHPLRVESVAWTTERRDLVCGLFSLLTLLAYVTAYRRGAPGRLHGGWYWAAVGLFVLALLSKSIVVGLPLVLLVLDLSALGRISLAAPDWPGRLSRLFLEKAPFFLLSAALVISMLALGISRELMTPLESLGIGERLAVSAYALVFYLRKTLIPWPLSPLYELHYPILPTSASYLGSVLAVLAITLVLFLARRRWPAGLAAWLAYVVLLLPVIGIAHNGVQIAADRYTYLACLGWAVLAGAGVTWCWGARRPRRRLGRLVVTLTATLVFALAALSGLQIRVWHDSETLWRHALAVDPESPSAHYHLAGVLAAKGRPAESRAELERAVELATDRLPYAKAVFLAWLGVALQRAGDLDGAERHYRAALGYSGDNVIALNNLGQIQARRGQIATALESFRHALRVIPGLTEACYNARLLAARLGVSPSELESCRPPNDRS